MNDPHLLHTVDDKLLHVSSDDGVTLYDPKTLVTTTLLDGEQVVSGS